MAKVFTFLKNTVALLLRCKTTSLLIYLLALRVSQASYNVTILLFYNATCDGCIENESHQLFHQNIFPRKSEVINFRWLQANATSIERSEVGVLSALSFLEDHSLTVDGAIFIDITQDSVAFSSLLESLHILTVGVFQEQEVFRTKEHPGDFTRVSFPSVHRYATSAWKILKKHRWRTICLIVSADFEGKTFVESMLSYAIQEKWQILKVAWLADDTFGNDTKTELQDIVRKKSNVIVMHSRLGHDGQFFEMIQELGVSRRETVLVITEITSHRIKNYQRLPQGLLKINLKRPEKHLDYIIYDNALHDAISLFQLSFEESVNEYCLNSDVKTCLKTIAQEEMRRISKRHLAQKSLSGRSMLFDPLAINSKHSTFTVWNLKKDGIGVNKWLPVGMGTTTGLAMEKFTAPNGTSITPVTEIPKPIVRVAVNEYSPFVIKMDPATGDKCHGRFVACYENRLEDISTDPEPKMFCCFGASLDFLSFLQKDLNFEAYIYFAPDGQYGVFNDTAGEWNGIVKELISGRAMLSLEMGLNSRRADVIGFAHPTLLLELGILVKGTGRKEVTRDSWLCPFSTILWLCLMGTSWIVAIVIWCLDRKSPQGYYHILKDSGEDGFTLLDSISYVGGVVFGKDIGPEKTPLSTSSRVVSYVYSFLALIMINSYCANLMAFLVEEKVGLPISGIGDPKLISEPPEFKVAAVLGSNEEDYFKRHVNSSYRKIYDVNLRKNSVTSLESGIAQMKAGTIDGLIGDYLSLQHIANTDKNCSFSLIKENSLRSGYGFAVSKNSPWLNDISLSVLKHQENNTVQTIEKRWFPETTCGSSEPHPLEAVDLVSLFWVVATVAAFSLLALLVETLMVFLLIKCGKCLGPFGRLLKRFLFNVKRGEEDRFTLQYHQTGLLARSLSVVKTSDDVTDGQQSCENQGLGEIRELERKIASMR
ncbi:hypothetical protein ACROYT_G031640 [Oculina patagonica]